jgi:hypothetical protein
MSTGEGDNFLVVETHSSKDSSQMIDVGLVRPRIATIRTWEAPLFGNLGSIDRIGTTAAPWNSRTTQSLNSRDFTRRKLLVFMIILMSSRNIRQSARLLTSGKSEQVGIREPRVGILCIHRPQ